MTKIESPKVEDVFVVWSSYCEGKTKWINEWWLVDDEDEFVKLD